MAQMQVLCSSMGPTSIGPMLDGYVASIVGAAPPGAPPLTGMELARCICSPGLDSSVFTGAFSPTIVPTLCSADCHAYMQFTLSVSTLSVSNPTDGPPPDFFACLCDVPATAAFMNGAPSAATLMRLQPELCASPACLTMMAAAPEGTFPFSCPWPPPLPPPPSPSPPKLPSPPELPSPPDLVDTRNAQTAAAPGGVPLLPLLPLLAAGGGGIAVLGLLVGVLLGLAIHRHRARTAFRQFREDTIAPLPATMPTLVSGQQANPLQAGVVIESPLQVEMVSKDVAQATDVAQAGCRRQMLRARRCDLFIVKYLKESTLGSASMIFSWGQHGAREVYTKRVAQRRGKHGEFLHSSAPRLGPLTDFHCCRWRAAALLWWPRW